MPLIEFPHIFIYFSIIITLFLYWRGGEYIFGVVLIAFSLLLFDFPDIGEYKLHYELAGKYGFEYVLNRYNFEPGYVLFASIFSLIFPFEVFYVFVISFAINAYLKFYNNDARSFIYAAFFLAVCLYFIAFTIRSTLASSFLAYAILYLRDGKNKSALAMILAGSMFHVVILPMIILVVFNIFSQIISRYYFLILLFMGALVILLNNVLSMNFFIGINPIVDYKIAAYEHANFVSISIFLGLWVSAFIASFFLLKKFTDLDKVLLISMISIIFLLYPFAFLQGRFMWLTSFLFAYLFIKSVIPNFNSGLLGGAVIVLLLPAIVFFRL